MKRIEAFRSATDDDLKTLRGFLLLPSPPISSVRRHAGVLLRTLLVEADPFLDGGPKPEYTRAVDAVEALSLTDADAIERKIDCVYRLIAAARMRWDTGRASGA